jgi:formylglycine-generating enzyme required for sulfatase activity
MVVWIDGSEIRIGKLGEPITLRAGAHNLEVTQGNLVVETRKFQIKRGQETRLEVTYTPGPRPAPPTPEEAVQKDAEAKKVVPPLVVRNKSEVKLATPAPVAELEFLTTRVGQIKLKRIPAGTFQMGSPAGEGDDSEHPQHEVRITQPFYLGVYEVTQGQYQAVMHQDLSDFKGSADLPVETVSWQDAVKFCNTLSEREGLRLFYQIDGEKVEVLDWSVSGYRLPTEAEWEYACRAGSTTGYSFGDGEARLGDFAWFSGNSGNKTHPVGQKQPNGFGLHDMHGNVWEWCWDGYAADYYKRSLMDDPRGAGGGSDRMLRGGSWRHEPRWARSAVRLKSGPGYRLYDLGFRVALGSPSRCVQVQGRAQPGSWRLGRRRGGAAGQSPAVGHTSRR